MSDDVSETVRNSTQIEEPIAAVPVDAAWKHVLDSSARESLEHEALPAFLQAQRWFGGKARGLQTVRIADWGPLPAAGDAAAAFFALLEVRFEDDETDLYFVPLAITLQPDAEPLRDDLTPFAIARLIGPQGEALLHDALADDAVCASLLEALRGGQEFPTRRGCVRAEATTAYSALRGDPRQPLPVVRAAPTSSNSLVSYGGRMLLKLFRRLEPGTNPDYEVGRFLTEQTPFDHLPQVAGALEYHGADDPPVTLGIVQALISNQGDGWKQAVEETRRYYEAVARRESDSPSAAAGDFGDYQHAAAILGRRTAEMHLALARPTNDPDFAPEPLDSSDIDALRKATLEDGLKAFAALSANLAQLPVDVAPSAHRLLDVGPPALARLGASPLTVPSAVKTRIHGDYHLGQVLWVENDYVLLDFEGEPTRTIDERRAKFSPLRDVAGMLRSYHYAAWAGLFAFSEKHSADLAKLVPGADRWHETVSAAFLKEYLATAEGASFLPGDRDELTALLDAFTLAKAFYELSYELNNRPDWVRIPLAGVLSLLDHSQLNTGLTPRRQGGRKR